MPKVNPRVTETVNRLVNCYCETMELELYLTSVLASLLSSPHEALRTNASKGFKALLYEDPDLVLRNKQVELGISAGLVDSSPQVRDATIGLVGQLIFEKPELLNFYY